MTFNIKNLIKYDKYGFAIREGITTNEETDDEKNENLITEKKWVSTLFNSTTSGNKEEIWSKFFQSNINSLIPKGIPSSLRGLIWKELLKIKELKLKNENKITYQQLLNKKEELNENTKKCILIDVNRIFPYHYYFKSSDLNQLGDGQKSIVNILSAYAIYNPDIRYTSGMMYIPSLLLIYMGEEDAFWGLFQIIENYHMNKLWNWSINGNNNNNMINYHLKFTNLLNSFMVTLFPKLVNHFKLFQIDIISFTASWFITLFIYSLPISYVVRIWDLFLKDGFVIIFAVCCTLFKIYENQLLSSDFNVIMTTFSRLNQGINYENNLKVDISKFIDLVVYYKIKIGNINNKLLYF